jgi:hypothetical protein
MSKITDELGHDREVRQVDRSTARVSERVSHTEQGDMDQEARDDAQRANSRQDSHERLCEERDKNTAAAIVRIEKAIGDITAAVNKRIGQVPATIISLLTGVVGLLGGYIAGHH